MAQASLNWSYLQQCDIWEFGGRGVSFGFSHSEIQHLHENMKKADRWAAASLLQNQSSLNTSNLPYRQNTAPSTCVPGWGGRNSFLKWRELNKFELEERQAAMEGGTHPSTQCAAVTIQLWVMMEPPQTWVPCTCRLTCHGHCPSTAPLPPTILFMMLTLLLDSPHSEKKKKIMDERKK